MPERSAVFQATQLGAETTPGTSVAAGKRLLEMGITPTPVLPRDPFRPAGSLAATTAVPQKEHSEGPLDGRWGFNIFPYLWSSILKKVTATTPAGATNTRRWTFLPDNFGPNNLQTFTIEQGGSVGAERLVYCLIQSLTMRLTEEEASLTGTVIGKKTTEGITITASPTDITPVIVGPTLPAFYFNATGTFTNEVQTITLGSPSAGNFKVLFADPLAPDPLTTANIAYNAAASAVQDAINTVVGANVVAVTGSAGGPYTVTFSGNLYAGLNVPQMTLDTTGLTGGTPSMATTTPGTFTKLERMHEFEFALSDRNSMGRTLDPAEPSFTYTVEGPPTMSGSMVVQHDATSQTFMQYARDVTTCYLRMVVKSPTKVETISGIPYPYGMRVTIPFLFQNTERSDRQNVWSSNYTLTPLYAPAVGSFVEAIVDCSIASL